MVCRYKKGGGEVAINKNAAHDQSHEASREKLIFTSLNDTEAEDRLRRFGPNELPHSKQDGFLSSVLRVFKEPMISLLIVAGLIYLFMGDLGEGLMLGGSVFVIIAISLYQEHKSEKALGALKELSSPRARVIRSGVEKKTAARLLVPGDLVALHEGVRVPADGVVLQSYNLSVDESLLSGESFATKKIPLQKDLAGDGVEISSSGLENDHRVFSSTLVVSGTALFRVLRTGSETEVGKIGKSLQEAEPEELNLNKEIRQMVKLFASMGALISLGVVVLYGLARQKWLEAFLVGLATQMSLLPEEFPVILTIFLAMGAWRLSKIQVLIRRPGSIERLGAVTVLCVDKTGTLTENRMSVAALHDSASTIGVDPHAIDALKPNFCRILEFGVLASHIDPYDPMEKAIRKTLQERDWGKTYLHPEWSLVRDYPLSDCLLAMSYVWRSDLETVVACKGAPEAVAGLCHLNQQQTQEVFKAATEMAKNGLRVLGVAQSIFSGENLPPDQHGFDFRWVGLIGLEDPVRLEVPSAVQLCRKAGIRVVMMTGDYPDTALKIAAKTGIDSATAVITGAELNSLSDKELLGRLATTQVFARMVPEQKLRIVKLLKSQGQVVAMTGDGVNDAPSLKWADVGVAMGARGTDVAREASDLVLLDDNFASIVAGIERGRLIFSNIRKAMGYIVSIHVSIAGLSILPVIFDLPLILLPVHIVFLELIIDPACSVMFESQSAEAGAMEEPPRSLTARLFSKKDLLHSFLQGVLVFCAVTGVLWFDSRVNHDSPERARAMAFIILSMSNIALIFADLTNGSLRQLKGALMKTVNLVIIVGVFAALILVTQSSRIQSLFRFGTLTWIEVLGAIAFSALVFLILSAWNRVFKRR